MPGLGVDAHVGDGVEPVAACAVAGREVGDVESCEEVLFHVPHAGPDLSLRFGTSRCTGIDVETKRLRVAHVDRMHGPPRAGPGPHRGFLVVDPDRGRHSAQAFQRRVVHRQPCVQRRDVARRLLPACRHVRVDRRVEPGRHRLLVRTPVRRTGRLVPTVVAHRTFRNPQQPSDMAVRTLSACQAPDRHPILPTEPGQGPSPSSRTETQPCQEASRPGRCENLDVVSAQVWGVALHGGTNDAKGTLPAAACSRARQSPDPCP